VNKQPKVSLARHMGLLGLASTGICSMLGASIYVVPFMIQRSVPGIGPYVVPAFLVAALPAILAAMAYSILASAMPRAGGSYIYASRGLNPFLGFVASFSQWFGLSIVIGVIAYVIIPFFRDIAELLEMTSLAATLDYGITRVVLALALLWIFVFVNILGVKFYERTVVPLMFLMFALGAVVIVAGFSFDHQDFRNAVAGVKEIPDSSANINIFVFLSAAAILFASFIGFDSIAQAGGEAKNPTSSLPKAIAIAVLTVGGFYFLFTSAIYHAVPWQFVASEAMTRDITAAGMLSYLIPSGWAIVIVLGAAIALLNDLPAMILSVSRLMFAWAEDGIFPKQIARVNARFHTPVNAIIAGGIMASVGIIGSHVAGDFFLGVDIMVTSMLVNFLLMCITVVALPKHNPELFKQVSVMSNRTTQLFISWAGIILLSGFLCIHIWKDLTASVEKWYFHSTPVWLIVMAMAVLVYTWERKKQEKKGVNFRELFKTLPPE
jgi:APA family basic amino acid/polyamine antiporter